MTDTVAATAVRIECVIEGRFSLSQAQNFIKRIMFAAGSHWQDHNHNRSRRLRVELVSFVPRKREPAPPRRWHHKIRRTRSGRDLPIADIVGYENEHVCEQLWRNSLLRSTSAPDSRRPAPAASRMD